MADKLIISVDAMGGDHGPEITIEGVEYYLRTHDNAAGLEFVMHGDEAKITELLKSNARARAACTVQHTDQAVDMAMKPSKALRRGKGTSMWNCIESVKTGGAKVGISAGNTGALMAMSKLQLRMKEGVQRPAIAAIWPQPKGMCVVLDVGANVECDAAQLVEFAVLGEAYFRALYGKKQPSIGLLNVGTEELKGNTVIKAAHERLLESELNINYIGYVEGNDITFGDVDVVVTDGFTGNIALKTAEGTAKLIGHYFVESLNSTLWSKFTTMLNYGGLKKLKKRMDPRRANGGVFLGLNGLMIKSHGGTDSIGFANALNIAVDLARSHFLEEIEEELTALHVEDDNIGFIP